MEFVAAMLANLPDWLMVAIDRRLRCWVAVGGWIAGAMPGAVSPQCDGVFGVIRPTLARRLGHPLHFSPASPREPLTPRHSSFGGPDRCVDVDPPRHCRFRMSSPRPSCLKLCPRRPHCITQEICHFHADAINISLF